MKGALKSIAAKSQERGGFVGKLGLEVGKWSGPRLVKDPEVIYDADIKSSSFKLIAKNITMSNSKVDQANLEWDGEYYKVIVTANGAVVPVHTAPAPDLKTAINMLGVMPSVTSILVPALVLGPPEKIDSIKFMSELSFVDETEDSVRNLRFVVQDDDNVQWNTLVSVEAETLKLKSIYVQTATPKRIRYALNFTYPQS